MYVMYLYYIQLMLHFFQELITYLNCTAMFLNQLAKTPVISKSRTVFVNVNILTMDSQC